MADNVTVGGVLYGTDDIGGAQIQRVKLTWGVDGSAADASVAAPLPVNLGAAATGTLSSVAASVTSVTILATNSNRKGALVFNDSTSTLALAFASSASLTAFTLEIPAQGFYEMSTLYTGIITGIWVAANGSARITELT